MYVISEMLNFFSRPSTVYGFLLSGGSSSTATASGAAASDSFPGSAMTAPHSEHNVSSESLATDQAQTYPGAPERDPWCDTPGSGTSKTGKFEEELAREERELFGGNGAGNGDGTGQPGSK